MAKSTPCVLTDELVHTLSNARSDAAQMSPRKIVKKPASGRPASKVPSDGHRCPQCRESALMLQRRHVSPARLGAPLVTEYYECQSCDASYKYSPADGRWQAIGG